MSPLNLHGKYLHLLDFQNFPAEQPVVRLQSGSNRPDISDESDSFTMEVDEDGQEGPNAVARTQEVGQTASEDRKLRNGDQTDPAGSHGSSASRPAPTSPQHRTPCPYGKDCYRYGPNTERCRCLKMLSQRCSPHPSTLIPSKQQVSGGRKKT